MDLYPLGEDLPFTYPTWYVSREFLPKYRTSPVLRVLPGNQLKILRKNRGALFPISDSLKQPIM
ncbi:hypothetical protein [Alicyclobacillus dauci]|uniref:Spore coat associated protein JA (CotJA) n=1 Tax=Alicyclobacillus dauci TaxID=1475485 RepID=A0ABY6Z3L9_9BACL|nr:hypothetical protein [Alicyclobacillus dauci]WAH37478.1 hypothetical protein NZD86_02760 [Alicyclobacillus dauci]